MKVVLYQPDIAGNLGSTIRLCACFETNLEIIEPCGFPLTDKALRRAAMDYGDSSHITRHPNWDTFRKTQSNRIILFTTKAATKLDEFKFEPNDVLVFGRESEGVPDHVHEDVDERVIIPISTQARSFNLANSVSIGLFEGLRQTNGLPMN